MEKVKSIDQIDFSSVREEFQRARERKERVEYIT